MSAGRDSRDPVPGAPMTPERWRLIDAVVKEALDRDAAARGAYLDVACAADDALRREVESLLAAAEVGDDFLERRVDDVARQAREALQAASMAQHALHESSADSATPPLAPPPPLVAALAGRYTIERELGRGGMATVYLAHDLRHRRPIALKVLRADLAAQLGAARFLREIEVAARLTHPHIVPLFDSGAADTVLYYVAPYVSGGSLRDWLRRDGALPVAEAVRVAREVALALAYAHRNGVVHRDIKPENVLLNEDRHALVADFGIARAVDRSVRGEDTRGERGGREGAAEEAITERGLLLGTPAYMAPEQAAGDPAIDHRADLYALGVLTYELLAGAHPFGKRAAPAMLAAHLSELPQPLTARRAEVPAALDALVLRLLAKRPDDRAQDAGGVVASLDEIASAAPRGSPPASLPLAAAPPRTRWRRRGVLLLTVAIAAAGVAAALVVRRGPASATTLPVVAVLPFENVGPPGDAYFADGLTDEVTTRLAVVSGLRVIGRASARQYRGSTMDPRDIARELGATHLLTGTVRWERDAAGAGRVRVLPELLRASDRSSVWGEPYEAGLEDVFRVQASVAERVAASLDVALLAGERRVVAARPTDNLAAYDAYLRALTGLARPARQSSAAARAAAIGELERAVALDPSFVAAHARLADAYVASYAVTGDPARLARARVHVDRAWALDSTLLESRLARARHLLVAGDPSGAYRVAHSVAAAAPGSAEAHFRLAEVQEALGQVDAAITSAERAAVIDPRSPEPPALIAGLYHMTRRYEESVRHREREILLAPDNVAAYFMQVICHLGWRADTAAARAVFERAGPALEEWLVRLPAESGMPMLWHAMLGEARWRVRDTLTLAGFNTGGGGFPPELFYRMKLRHFAITGRPDRARAYADTIVTQLAPASRQPSDLFMFGSSSRRALVAEAHAVLGHTDDAAREAERSIAEARDRGPVDALSIALVGAARVDVLAGRRARAIARLEEVFSLPSGEWISPAMLRGDASWAPLWGEPGFKRFLAAR